jgi:hypothetical protein
MLSGVADELQAPGDGGSGRRRLHQAANNVNDPFVRAPICKGDPNPKVAVPDAQGRLFARQNKVLCAYRDKMGAPVFYTNYQPASWLHTPACTDPPFDAGSVAVSMSPWHLQSLAAAVDCMAFGMLSGRPVQHHACIQWQGAFPEAA